MKILLNLIPIKKGGGQQVAFNFMNIIVNNAFSDFDFFILATDKTFMAEVLNKQKKYAFRLVKNDPLSRILFERTQVEKIVKDKNIDIIYTLFGPPIFSGKVKSISGTAYSNIFFPEINFWTCSFVNRAKHYLIDKYRLNKTLRSDALIFENSSMMVRAERLFNYHNSVFIRPSISFNDYKPSQKYKKQLRLINEDAFNILMLTGWHPNKNIEKVPEILKALERINQNNVEFVITVDPEDSRSKELLSHAKSLGVGGKLKLIGGIATTDIKYLIQQIDCILLISLLESFSNNIIEAWTYKKPLVITDAEWSRSICNTAALYTDRESVEDIAHKLDVLCHNKAFYDELVAEGLKEIEAYPSPKQKVEKQLTFIKEFHEKEY